MSEIQKLIELATHELENMNSSASMVGNRPHFPMLVMSNNMSDEALHDRLYRKMRRIWPQTVSKLIFASYKIDGSSYKMTDNEGNNLSEDEVKVKLDEIKMIRDTFAEMRSLNIYNIIDTSIIDTLDDFKKLYDAGNYFKDLVVGSCKSMAIVLLDDSTVKHNVANEIRLYLADNGEAYDGVIVVANRTYGDSIYEMKDLYKIAANVIILSNNDSFSQNDDSDYTSRQACFYNNHMNTVSYSLFERPNKDISIQLVDTFLRNAEKCIADSDMNFDTQSWRKKLGITDKIDVCEEFIKSIPYSFDISALEYIPFKNGDEALNIRLNDITYGQFKGYTYGNVLEQFIDNYYNEVLLKSIDMNACFVKFEQVIKANISAWNMVELKDDVIENIFSGLRIGSISETLNLSTYIKDLMFNSIRENVIYPNCKKIIKKLQREANETISSFYRLKNEFIECKPIDGFEKIGTMYQLLAESYLKTERGETDINRLISAGNTEKDFADILLEMVKNTIANNKSKFMMPFINEWAERLGLAGDVIYNQIHKTLDKDIKDKIHLFGLFPIENTMQVYILHTSDAKGDNKTELFNHLNSAYKDVPGVQFFNTGFDDSLEVMKFYDCSGDKLKVMGV